jgi:hypothetical protein
MPDAAWVLASDAEAWETHARACFAASVDGECPLDVTRKNILNFAQGSFSLVEADLRATLPADLAVAVTEALVTEGLAEAFDLRKNLVSLKKVLLHCWHAADPLEHELRRMATFWRDDMNFENGFVQVDRYREVCVAHMRCKGASHAAYDGRVLTKQICCVPRHPDAPRPARLKEMPKSLTTRSWLRQARDALRRRRFFSRELRRRFFRTPKKLSSRRSFFVREDASDESRRSENHRRGVYGRRAARIRIRRRKKNAGA